MKYKGDGEKRYTFDGKTRAQLKKKCASIMGKIFKVTELDEEDNEVIRRFKTYEACINPDNDNQIIVRGRPVEAKPLTACKR